MQFPALATSSPPPAAPTAGVDSDTARDLPVCEQCLAELFDPYSRRFGYPYINCTDCGPRYSITERLPYDRAHATMAGRPMCDACRREYEDVTDRRFQAQPIACGACGPHVRLEPDQGRGLVDAAAIAAAARLLAAGAIVAIKGIGGCRVACDATNPRAVDALRTRTGRKKPFPLMVRDLSIAHAVVQLFPADEERLRSAARPIVAARARVRLPHVAPDNADLGVMLPCTPIHHLLFAVPGVPATLVMTSGNQSSEPIAYEDDDAQAPLIGIADAILVGERPATRRVDDFVGGRRP